MQTDKNITLAPELFEQVTEQAQVEGKTPDELANEAMKRYLALQRLQKLQQYGRRRAEELGIGEADVPRLVAESRNESRGQ